MKRLLLVDGHAAIYRSYYAFIRKPLRDSRGQNTSAVFGFEHLLARLLDEEKPDYCAVVFDAPGETFRHRQYEAYKGHRPAMPDELAAQVPVIRSLVEAHGIAGLELAGVEADDVLATLALRGAEAGFAVVIVTTDKDLLQLVGGSIAVLDPWRDVRYGPVEVRERLGVSPERVTDLLGLAGDDSDNIAGVPGIGPKRALQILERFPTFEQALAGDERVAAHAELARLSRSLATAKTDVAVPRQVLDLALGQPDRQRLRELYKELEFRNPFAAGETEPAAEPADAAPVLGGAVVIETDGSGTAWLLSDGQEVRQASAAEREGVLDTLGACALVGFDLKGQMRRSGLSAERPWFDVRIAAWMVDPNRGKYRLADAAASAQDPIEPAERARLIARAYSRLRQEMAALALLRPAEQIEMPLIAVLARMESRGIRLDRSRLARMKTELGAEAGVLRANIVRLAGVEFNPDSPKQLGEVLFERLKLPRGRKTRTGYSTDSSVLERLAARHEVCREVLRYRELTKLCRTYLGPLPAAIDERTGRVHATFEQTGTATGRLSSLEPNLQNIPARTAAGQLVRQAFVPEPGNVFVSADYSQIELRVLAHLARDAVLTSAFEQGEDVHRTTAALVLGVDRDSVVPEQRRLAKVINYGIVYGMGERNLAVQTGLAVEQAREFLDAYLARFQGVAQWRDRVVEQARAEGLVRTIAGRIRPVPGVADRNRVVAEASKRAAINAPVQGSAADIVKVAMLGIERGMNDAGHSPGMILQVHDELLFEVPEPAAGEVAELVKHEMENAWALAVPLVADVRTGANWAEAHRS